MVELTDNNIPWTNQYTYTSSEDRNNCSLLLKKADALKSKVSTVAENPGSKDFGEKLSDRIALQDLYRKLLISNLEYALDKKIEQDLWNVVFKNYITSLQQKVKDKSNVKRSEIQNQLNVFLEASSGFYAQLLQDLCEIFHLVVPCRVPISQFSILNGGQGKHNVITQPERPSCQYMCQHCLVHLGDIARYRNQSGQAESYYRHAAQLVPSNGQPYNQLAILAAASGDMLSMAFYYCRSLAVKCPFPASSTNLKRQLSKIMDSDEPRHAKLSISELMKYFLKFHACIYLKKNEEKLEKMSERLISYLQLHLRAGSLNQQHLVHITFLNLFSLCHRTLPLSNSPVSEKLITEHDRESFANEKNTLSWRLLLCFTLQLLDLLLACVPIYSEDLDDLDHLVLPAVKLSLDWLVTSNGILERDEIKEYPRLWNRLASVLNALKNQKQNEEFENFPLPEDLEVRGFVGLKESLNKWNFSQGCESVVDISLQHMFRCHRLFILGQAICSSHPELLASRVEDIGTVFFSPLEFTNASPITTEDVILEDDDVVESPPPGNALDRGKDWSRKQGNSQLKSDIKLNAIKEEDNSENQVQDGSKKLTDSPTSSDLPPSKPTHHVTFAPMPDKHSFGSSKHVKLSPPPDSPSGQALSPPVEYGKYPLFSEKSSFSNYRPVNELQSPITPDEQEFPFSAMNQSTVGLHSQPQPYQYSPTGQAMSSQYPPSYLRSGNLPFNSSDLMRNQNHASRIQQEIGLGSNNYGVHLQSTTVSPTAPIQQSLPIHVQNSIENSNRLQQMQQAQTQRNVLNQYLVDKQIRALASRTVKSLTQEQSIPQPSYPTMNMAARFSGLQQPVNKNRLSSGLPNSNVKKDFIPLSLHRNMPDAFPASAMQQNFGNFQPIDMQQNRGFPPAPQIPDTNVRNLSNPTATSLDFIGSAQRDDYNRMLYQLSTRSPQLIGHSPDGSNNTSSTSSPTPGMNASNKASPHAGTKSISIASRPQMNIPLVDPYSGSVEREVDDTATEALLAMLKSKSLINDPVPGYKPAEHSNAGKMFVSNDQDFSDKPCREDSSTDIFGISPGKLSSFEKQDSYKLFPDTDSTWSIGQGNRRNGHKLGSIGSERAAFAHQQFGQVPSMPQFSPWSDTRQYHQKEPVNPSMTTKESTFERSDDIASFWSSPMHPSGPSALEQLLRQQQENHHKSPP